MRPELSDAALLASMESVRVVVELGRRGRDDARIRPRQPLREVIVATDDPVRRDHVVQHVELIAAELGVKQVRLTTSAEEFAQVEVMPLLKLLGPKYGRELAVIRGLLREGDFELRDGSVHVGDWVLEPGEFELRARAREGFAVADGDGFAVALDTEITPELRLEGAVRDLIRRIQVMRQDAGFEVTDRIRIIYPEADGDATRAFERTASGSRPRRWRCRSSPAPTSRSRRPERPRRILGFRGTRCPPFGEVDPPPIRFHAEIGTLPTCMDAPRKVSSSL